MSWIRSIVPLCLLLLLCTPTLHSAFVLNGRPCVRRLSNSVSHSKPIGDSIFPLKATIPPNDDAGSFKKNSGSREDGVDFSSASGRDVDLSVGVWPRENRQLLGLLGGLGFLETAYLTYQKLTTDDLTSLCTSVAGLSMRCGDVLNSEYASFLGVPLTLPGAVAYGTVTALALWPILAGNEGSRERAEADLNSRAPLLTVTTGMATFSAYLMWVLATQVRELCPYCLASASLSFSMAALTWVKQVEPNATKSLVYKAGAVVVTGLFSLGAFAYASARIMVMSQGPGEGGEVGGSRPPPITTHSTARSEALALRLQDLDARMYGAFWCSHCYEQKQSLGQEAYRRIAYIECAPDGFASESKICKARKIPGYPTWEIKGELYPGEKSLDQLEDIVDGKVPVPPPMEIPAK
ncbi:Vitamin K epoxide reductase [Nannochloropsis gaditana]|uniref:Vitamin K epoxide reductase n=1 Tax=Nannochloropsis gaditana TaxID=72520 RepID=W7TFV8_9STRA|nr:Vitamin K epoxide reductase [Nannochloropsis gaditana]